MAWHTIEEAQKLTGKSRRTLYRDMASGQISWDIEHGGKRRLETSELIRVYGALTPLAQNGTDHTAHDGTANGTQETSIILAELKLLREEVAELRKTLYLIEYKPDMSPDDTDDTSENRPRPKQSLWSWWKKLTFRQ